MVMETDPQHAWVETMGFRYKINIQLIEDIAPGEYVLVHAGFAIQKIDMEEYDVLRDVLGPLET